MTAAAPLAFPGSRSLAGWWRQLAPWQPRRLWVAHLFLHRIEAPVRVRRVSPLERLDRLVLQVLERGPGATLKLLDDHLHLGRQFLRQVVRGLEVHHLVQAETGGGWSLTAPGRDALGRGTFSRPAQERRTFCFLHPDTAGRPPPFLDLRQPGVGFRPAGEGWTFNVAHLQNCLRQSQEWKQRHGFPPEVEETLTAGVPEWQGVIVDHPEHLTAVLVLAPGPEGAERLLGFAARPDGWLLNTSTPALESGPGWEQLFPELAREVPPALWRQAWHTWCQPRGLPPRQVEACRLEKRDHRLRVLAEAGLVERLRVLRSDALKGEAWVVAGEGPVREAALLEVVADQPQGVSPSLPPPREHGSS